MIEKLKQLFNTTLNTNAKLTDNDHAKQLAAVALMLDVIAVDDEQHETEIAMLHQIVSSQFDVTAEAATDLIQQAEYNRREATDYYHFTSEINRYFSEQEKIDLIQALWQLAWADNEIHDLEQHVIRRLATLLHVSHKDFIATRLAVMQ